MTGYFRPEKQRLEIHHLSLHLTFHFENKSGYRYSPVDKSNNERVTNRLGTERSCGNNLIVNVLKKYDDDRIKTIAKHILKNELR